MRFHSHLLAAIEVLMTWETELRKGGTGRGVGVSLGSLLMTVVCVCLYRWTAAEAEEYVRHIHSVALARGSQKWKFDLQWLSDHNFSIPKQLQNLCRATHITHQ